MIANDTKSIAFKALAVAFLLMLTATAVLGQMQPTKLSTKSQQRIGAENAPAVMVQQVWNYTTGSPVTATPAVADLNGDGKNEVIAGAWDGKVYCLNSTGGFKWSYQTGAAIYVALNAADIDGDGQQEVLVGSNDHSIYCLSSNGGLKWSYQTGGRVVCCPAAADIDGDGRIEVVAGSMDHAVYCLNSTGGLKWNYTTGSFVEAYNGPVLADVNGDTKLEVIIGSGDNNTYCLNGTGKLAWSYATDGYVISTPAVADLFGNGRVQVVVGSWDRQVYCLNGTTGSKLWNYSTGDLVQTRPTIADVDGDGQKEVVIGSEDYKAYCLNGKTGGLKWSYAAGGGIGPSAIGDLYGDGETEIIVGSADGNITCLNGTGTPIWSYPTSPVLYSDPAPIVADVDEDGVVEALVGSDLGRVYCLRRPDTSSPATVIDLATSSPTADSISLTWTAPGDNGMVGNATGYVVKYSTTGPISASGWDSATTYTQSWTPAKNGTIEMRTITGLASATTYWFAVKAYDKVPNYSGISNSPSGSTSGVSFAVVVVSCIVGVCAVVAALVILGRKRLKRAS